MPLEIERKFLVTQPLAVILYCYSVKRHLLIEQCYLSQSGEWTIRGRRVRMRTIGNRVRTDHYLTMKRRVSDVSQVELETQVPKRYYNEIKEQSQCSIEKKRYEISYGGMIWELDAFHQPPFEGLMIAEIELNSEDALFTKPAWLGEEVTHDKQYRNVRMAKRVGEAECQKKAQSQSL